MELLAALFGVEDAEAAQGATRIGAEKDIMTEAGFRRTAAVYRLAFAQKKQCFPYFTVESFGARGRP